MISWICAIILMNYQDIQRLHILTKHDFSIILTHPHPRNNKTSMFLLETLHEDRTLIYRTLNILWCASCLLLFKLYKFQHTTLWALTTHIFFFFTQETLIVHIRIHKPVRIGFIQLFPCTEFEQNHAMLFKSKSEIVHIDLLPCPRVVISGYSAKTVF